MKTTFIMVATVVMVVALILVAGCASTTASASTTKDRSDGTVTIHRSDGTVINYSSIDGSCSAQKPNGQIRECTTAEKGEARMRYAS
jgi:ABC-type glycerol-3-phosphate transport system substrate-binding protein